MAFNPEYQTRIGDGMVVRFRHPFYRRAGHRIQDVLDDFNLPRVCYKIVASTYVLFMVWGFYLILPLPGHWSPKAQPDASAISQDPTKEVQVGSPKFYFEIFTVAAACRFHAPDLYVPAENAIQNNGNSSCATCQDFPQAISKGNSNASGILHWVKGCHYRWDSTGKICIDFRRFDAIVFVGNVSLEPIYNAVSALLRQNLVKGSLANWDVPDENQFTEPLCSNHFLASNRTSAHDALSMWNMTGYGCSLEGPQSADETGRHSGHDGPQLADLAGTQSKFGLIVIEAPQSVIGVEACNVSEVVLDYPPTRWSCGLWGSSPERNEPFVEPLEQCID
ncbi:hypothetical protein A1O3_10345 [Capronia epimyces CBS 606.96]|uniref:Uncharacterized protein n=1 Tax=Capronia epimyces CBS 606.96 TaxID=1182542 RepID=W9X9P5_9EURO|nr:uncharacterized protein A1O3_10345 [Capronia epimyces CBS 606.96]EXJ77187.1 hypothetical protein A1O3_10345 [Capronia epimyces CBS 606.96]